MLYVYGIGYGFRIIELLIICSLMGFCLEVWDFKFRFRKCNKR